MSGSRSVTRARPSTSVEALRADVDIQDALALNLPVAIREAVDIAFHIAADRRGETATGAIVARDADRKLRYAVRANQRLTLWTWDDELTVSRVEGDA